MDLELLRLTPAILFATDPSGRVVEVSDTWIEAFDMAREEAVGALALDWFTGDSKDEWARASHGTIAFVNMRRGDGSHLRGRLSVCVQSGDSPLTVVVVEDVGDQVQIQRVMSLTRDPMCVADLRGGLIFVNDAWEAILGINVGALSNRQLRDLIHPADLAATDEHIARLAAGHPVHAIATRYRAQDGTYRLFLWTAVSDPEEDRLYAVGRDITETHQAETTAHKLDLRLYEAQKSESLATLAGGVAHDFNNLLMSVIGNAELALECMAVAAIGREEMSHILASAHRASELCHQLMAYSGGGQRDVRSVDLSQLTREVHELTLPSLRTSARLRRELRDDLPPIEVDVNQVRQVVVNLVMNAAEAFEDQGGEIALITGVMNVGAQEKGVAQVGQASPGSHVYLDVIDDGAGMDDKALERMFDPFFTTRTQGRGLGLASVAGIIRDHEGEIRVTSVVGEGTRVRVLFPCCVGTVDEMELVPNLQTWSDGGRVLVVDDEDSVRRVARRILENRGFEVVTARDGQEGVDVFSRDPEGFSLMVMDLTMPRLDGVRALEEMRRVCPSAPAILTSGYSEENSAVNVELNNSVTFLQKPYGIGALVEAVRTAIEG
jgi:two-component system, cell cycle sensor histidine kinase and response regulator CckA